MTLALVGGTHRTVPLALRERLVFTAEQAAEDERRIAAVQAAFAERLKSAELAEPFVF
jgi:glutamyl-tRNA reductase